MSDSKVPEVPRLRTWREIAYEMTHETNRAKIAELSRELSEAFEMQQKSGKEHA